MKLCPVCGAPAWSGDHTFCKSCTQLWRESPELARGVEGTKAVFDTARDDFVRRMQAEARNGGRHG